MYLFKFCLQLKGGICFLLDNKGAVLVDLQLQDKVVAITGGSKGIGFQTALQFVQEGAKVAICARGEKQLQVAQDSIFQQTGKKIAIFPCDVSKEEDCKQFIEGVIEHYGQVDILINNAGTAAANSFENVSSELWKSDLDLKLFSTIHCSTYAVENMKKRKSGSIINVTAVLAKTPPASSLPTTVSRAAGIALTKAMSNDLGPAGIRVNTVCIGLIRSNQIENRWKSQEPELSWDQYSEKVGQSIPLRRIGKTEEAANMIVFLASPAASYITGTAVNIDGGSSPMY